MKLNKKFIFILSLVYLLFSLGIGNYALCMGACDKSESGVRTIRCACCAHKEKHCNCFKNKVKPYNFNAQSTNYVNYIADVQNACNKGNLIFSSIIYKDIEGNKIKSQQTLLLNKNLDMLRSVILLN